METWRLLDTGFADPYQNMAVDEAILWAHSEGIVPPTVRFYGWNPATLSIGYFQKAHKDVDHHFLQDKGLGFVRRPTGGRAVLHDQELTYSVVLSEAHPFIPSSVNESYRILSRGLMEGFLALGLDARMVSLSNESEKAKFATLSTAACFDSPSWYELVVEGRKVAGSAQMRHQGTLLQHGSILLDFDIELLFKSLIFPSEEKRQEMMNAFREKAISIKQLSGQNITYETAVKAFTKGFERGLGIQLEPAVLTNQEIEQAQILYDTKYSEPSWNFRK